MDFLIFPPYDNRAMEKAQRKRTVATRIAYMKTQDVQSMMTHYEVDIDSGPRFQEIELSLERMTISGSSARAKGSAKNEEDKKTRKVCCAGSGMQAYEQIVLCSEKKVKAEDIPPPSMQSGLKLANPKAGEKKPQVRKRKYIATRIMALL